MTQVRNFIRIVCALVFLTCATVASAQLSPSDRGYYDGWLVTAEQAEQLIDDDNASNVQLEQIRAQITDFRQYFSTSGSQNSARIKTLQSQLDALGPKPEDGTEEAVDIAELRKALTEQLDTLKVPRVVAEEAFNRANGLIGEIDRIVRERQASELLSRGPTPLNPVYWPIAARDVKLALTALTHETTTAWNTVATHNTLEKEWPVLVLMLLVGSILMVMGGTWSAALGNFLHRLGGEGIKSWSFVVSLSRIFIPMLGLLTVCYALSLSGLLGLRGTKLISSIPVWGGTYLAFRWLGDRLFARPADERFEFLKPYHQAEARILVLLLGVVLVLNDAVRLYQEVETISEGSRVVVAFPPVLFGALILLRLQRIGMRRKTVRKSTDDAAPQSSGASKLIAGLRRGVTLAGILSPILVLVGYLNAAQAILYPAILTLAAISFGLELYRFFGDLYCWLSRKGDAGRDSLFMVLVGFALSLLALPVLALIWGTRVENLLELWEQFVAGFTIGGIQISPTSFLTFTLIFSVGYTLTKLLQSGLRSSLLPKTSIDAGGQNAIVAGVGYVGVFLASLVAITGAGIDLSSLAIVAGALSVGIGFGLQTIVSNFVSGIILLVERPISKGDWIEVGGLMGYVRDISVRSTRIETFDRTDVIVPNSDLISGTVTNYTRGNTIGRAIVPVGVAYGTDTKWVESILREIAEAHPMVLVNPAPNIVFQGFGASSLDFEIRAILRDVNWVLSVKSDMNHEIARRFAEEGIEIPFAQRDVWLRNPEVLQQPPAEST